MSDEICKYLNTGFCEFTSTQNMSRLKHTVSEYSEIFCTNILICADMKSEKSKFYNVVR